MIKGGRVALSDKVIREIPTLDPRAENLVGERVSIAFRHGCRRKCKRGVVVRMNNSFVVVLIKCILPKRPLLTVEFEPEQDAARNEDDEAFYRNRICLNDPEVAARETRAAEEEYHGEHPGV
ncbi:MAG: hypothetical protein WCV84_06075 [Patescibacteria group bacterium]